MPTGVYDRSKRSRKKGELLKMTEEQLREFRRATGQSNNIPVVEVQTHPCRCGTGLYCRRHMKYGVERKSGDEYKLSLTLAPRKFGTRGERNTE